MARWIGAAVAVVAVASFTSDRLVGAYGPHWWTSGVRSFVIALGVQVAIAIRTRPTTPARFSVWRGWVRTPHPSDDT
jgi:hypothetical protein